MIVALAAAVAAALGYGAGSLLQALAVRAAPNAAAAVRRPAYLAGLLCDGGAWLLSLVALRQLPLFVVQSVLAGSLAVTALLARLVLRTPLRRGEVVAIGVLVAALGVLGAAGGPQAATRTGRGVTVGLVAGLVALLVATGVGWSAGPVPLAVLAGLGFSGAALSARVLHGSGVGLLAQPLSYAVLVYGGVGALAYAQALERGRLATVTALLWVVEVVIPSGVGIAALGDQVRGGWWPAALLALVAVVGASAALARRAGDPAAGPSQELRATAR